MRVFIAAGEGGLSHNSWAKCDQVMTLEKNLVRYPATGALAPATLQKIEEQIRICLGLVR